MAKTQEFNITAGTLKYTTSTATVGGATSRETVKVTLVPADPEIPEAVLVQGTDYDAGEYRLDGVADASNSVSIYWPQAAQHVGDQLRVDIFTDLDNPVDAQLHNFQSSGTNTPRQFQEQLQQIFSIFLQIVGVGTSLGDVSLGSQQADIEALYAENDAQDVILDDHETRITDNEYDILQNASMILSGVGLPPISPAQANYLLSVTPSGNSINWSDPEAVLAALTTFTDLAARVTVNEGDIATNVAAIAANVAAIATKYTTPSGTVWHSDNDGPGSGLNADTLRGFYT